jgi:predicted phage terminase large subunit-like protein
MDKEVFFGGAAGGGKSAALLMSALQYIDVPNYAALILRRTFSDLALPGAIMDRAADWLRPSPAKWIDQTKTWQFPSGATLTFGYLETENDKYRYASAEFQFVGFDELSQFSETQYRFLFSRLRRLKGSKVPIRMRSASNPGGYGHKWVKQRFIEEGKAKGRIFIPSLIQDNPHLDSEEYIKSLSELDPVTREQLLKGNWDISERGEMFKREWFANSIVDILPVGLQPVRFWDLAATEVKKKNQDPDWTAGALVAMKDGVYYILDIQRTRSTPQGVENLIKFTAELDGPSIPIYIEIEGGASGITVVDHYQRSVLVGYPVYGVSPSGSKAVRAMPLSSAAQAGNVKFLRGEWIGDFVDELELFPLEAYGVHDDQVDAVASGARIVAGTDMNQLYQPAAGDERISVAGGILQNRSWLSQHHGPDNPLGFQDTPLFDDAGGSAGGFRDSSHGLPSPWK